MTVFTVHAPGGDALAAARNDRLSFVPEKISWGALVVPILWAPRHRLWLVLTAWLAATVAIEIVALKVDARLGAILSLAFAVWFGLAGNDFRRWTLTRRGHGLVGVVEARDEDEAAARFLGRLAAKTNPGVASTSSPEFDSAVARSGVIGVSP